jgi:hypothetical protein
MLKLRTRTQQTLALIVTAWCASSATLERWQRVEKRSRSEKCDHFLLPRQFSYNKFLTERCTANETLKSWLLTLSTGNSIKAKAWAHQGKTTGWLEDRNWATWTQCSLTLLSSLCNKLFFIHSLSQLTPYIKGLQGAWSNWYNSIIYVISQASHFKCLTIDRFYRNSWKFVKILQKFVVKM